MKKYFKNLLIALDQLINTIFNGYPDETLSSVSYRLSRDNICHWKMKLIDTIFFFDYYYDSQTGRKINHCEGSYISEKESRQLPPEFRN